MRRGLGLLMVVAMIAAGCTASEGGAGDPAARGDGGGGLNVGDEPLALPDDLLLVSFDACEDFYDHITARALELVGPWGLDGGGGRFFDGLAFEEADDAMAGDADGASRTGAPEMSGTNVQEVGVDEPDIVKTDGQTMYVATEGRLSVLDIREDEPREIASLELAEAWDARMLLDGDHLLVTSSSPIAIPFAGERISSDMWGGWGTTTLVLVDVSDPSAPHVAERLTVDGSTVSARLVDGVARVVVRTEQGNLPWVYPEGSGLRAERRAEDANRELIRNSEVEDWIPWMVHRTADGEEREGPALACNRIARPSVFSGLGVLSVLTIDIGNDSLVPGGEAVGVLTGGDTVYASTEALYVGTTQWVAWDTLDDAGRERRGNEITTTIHAFDTSDPNRTDYLASGTVPGTLLSQWAMSEYEGRLRVASTAGDPWAWARRADASQSYVTVLEPMGDVLGQVGQVGGLGPTESIHAVRFIGDVGYVVTFRQTDPLYTVDLSDPTNPVARGELKILGYSAYLHPVGDDLLLGVGQDADEQGMLKGTQLSLFDVADLDDPVRIDTVDLGQGSSEVEYEHHAFLHWPATGLTVVPFIRYTWDETGRGGDEVTSGAATFTADRDGGIREGRVLTHTAHLDGAADADADGYVRDVWDLGWYAQIRRSTVVGDRLLTVSEAGVAVHDLETLEDLGWAPFGR